LGRVKKKHAPLPVPSDSTHIGLGIHSNHIVGILALTLPVIWAIHNRIGIEEAAMKAFFGIEYKLYKEQTRKLVPYIY
jgi:protein-S-isoprenylcysteine O-methyltransferase Ste14